MMQQINLYQPLLRTTPKVFSARTMGQILAIVVLGLLVLYGWGFWRTQQLQTRVQRLKAEQTQSQTALAKLHTQLSQRHVSAALKQAAQRAQHERKSKTALLAALSGSGLGANTNFAPPLAGLAKTRVTGLWLTGIHIGQGGQALILHGRTTRSAKVPKWVAKLGDVSAFSGVAFEQFKINRNKHGQLVFTLATQRNEKLKGAHVTSN